MFRLWFITQNIQDTDDRTGQEMWETVEEYADINEACIAVSFVIAFIIS